MGRHAISTMRAERVALAAALNTEQADGVRLVQVERDLSARGFPEKPELLATAVVVPRITSLTDFQRRSLIVHSSAEARRRIRVPARPTTERG